MVKEILMQAPSLAVLAYIVKTFIGSLDKRDAMVAQMHHESMAERKELRQVIRENVEANNNNTTALNNLAHVITLNKSTR